jgi:hypothetical protein
MDEGGPGQGACQEPVSAAAVKLLRRQEGEREGGGGEAKDRSESKKKV